MYGPTRSAWSARTRCSRGEHASGGVTDGLARQAAAADALPPAPGFTDAGFAPEPARPTRPAAPRPAAALAGSGSVELDWVDESTSGEKPVPAAVRTGRRTEAAAHVTAMYDAHIAAISPRLALLAAGSQAIAAPDSSAPGLFEEALAIPGVDHFPFDLARVQLMRFVHALREWAWCLSASDTLVDQTDAETALLPTEASVDGNFYDGYRDVNWRFAQRLADDPRWESWHAEAASPLAAMARRTPQRSGSRQATPARPAPPFGRKVRQ